MKRGFSVKIGKDISELTAVYGKAGAASTQKVAARLTPEYQRWIEKSHFCAFTSVGPDGTDCTPRGDDGPVVQIMDPGTLLMPDWRGNNRMDTLRNIVADGRVSLMFMVQGSTTVVRVNGQAVVALDADVLARFNDHDQQPRSVVVISIGEIYFQCARALMRSNLWSGHDRSAGLPTAGEFLAAMTNGAVDRADYDKTWPERAAKSMW